ncbi:MAG TPA: glutamine-hydrolyzing GMP synthase [Aggregatilineales bacterium]|nr:glutamine-hydrolyzing GMP synthase [Anaerolineales bacterium]HRE49271.1 glutamine-hydrolyzing GMP synthase [Aggregatilineales bacterium]
MTSTHTFTTIHHSGGIAILDYGSQYTQLIARRVREQDVYAEIFPWDAPPESVLATKPVGFILSGGPNSVYDEGAPMLPRYVLEQGIPVLGVCYGMQLLAQALGGRVAGAAAREYGAAVVTLTTSSGLFCDLPPQLEVFMSHGDRLEAIPPGWESLAQTSNSPYAAMGDPTTGRYGVQFHPEVTHTPLGGVILRNFARDLCRAPATWTPASIISENITAIRDQVGEGRVVLGLSGGVDSAVAAALIHRAIGDQLTPIFINNGLMRLNEPEQVVATFRDGLGMHLVAVDATEEFLSALAGVTDPETKRKTIGRLFVRLFEAEARKLGDAAFLAQGTIYPDVIESAAKERPGAHRIKTHHNVGGLPEDMHFQLVEPLRYLFKDEVRRVGTELGLPEAIIWRQPFPGPGLAVRCLGEITWERLERLRAADAIVTGELGAAGLLRGETAQAFAVLLPVKSVGVMGDGRTYQEPVILRAVVTDDFMTAHWARLPYDILARISERIVNEVPGVNRVAYDITSKPPATIEWE